MYTIQSKSMAAIIIYTSLALLFIFLIFKHLTTKRHNLPPTPATSLPILGHLHLLKQPLHRTFRRFSQTHGPIFSLKLGVRQIVVVSSPNLVEQCLTATNDIILSNRPRTFVTKYLGYNQTTMLSAPYGHHWRNLRKLGAQEALSPMRLNSLSTIREHEVQLALKNFLTNKNYEFTKIDLRPKLFEIVLNQIMMMLTGKRYAGEKFQELVSESIKYSQALNPEDLLPFLLWIDYRGLKRKIKDIGKRMDDFYETLLDDHRKEKRNSVVGHLLTFQESEPELYTDQTIKGFISSMIVAGTDTSTLTIEWAMSLLLNHPNILQQAKLELDAQIGHNRLLEERDLPNLNYLRKIILETFRLFPAAPLLVPRMSSSDCKLGGYHVPHDTILFVNAWAIHRDPKVWDEPDNFKPERFDEKEVETQKLMPFGIGRRACPGSGLGHRMVGVVLGSLIHCFDWEGVDFEQVDLREGVGLTMHKLKPLEVMCRPREVMSKVLQESE